MHRGRNFLASVIVLSFVSSLIGVATPARAGGFAGTAQTDFTQVTPNNAILYSTLQETNPDQGTNLKTLESVLSARGGMQTLLKQVFGADAGNLSNVESAIGGALTSLRTEFDGELGLALLPVSLTAASQAKPSVTLHLLLDAGLQSGVSFGQLSAELALLGPAIVKQSPAYHNLPVVELDLRGLIRSAESSASGELGTANAARNGLSTQSAVNVGLIVGSRRISPAISGIFYGAVAGNVAVLASDLPTLKHSIDTYFGTAPSISGVYDFQQTVSSLPADRLVTSYLHFDTEQWRPLMQALAVDPSFKAMVRSYPAKPGTLSEAYSISAEPTGILSTLSPRVTVGSLATSAGLTATSVTEPGFLPSDALAYFGLNDPGTILRDIVIGAYAGAMAAQKNPHLQPGDINISQILANGDAIIKQIDQRIGINLDDQVLSWMHVDASITVLPVGSKDFGSNSPTTRLSVVATLRLSNQVTVEADLALIRLALQAIPNSGLQGLNFVEVPTTAGNPLEMLASTPTGIGYTFYNGYLIVASALPADFSGIVKASAGGSLASDPVYKAAFAYMPSRPYGTALYANLTGLRQTIESMARASGADMRDYDSTVRPVLQDFSSFAAVTFAGPSGGCAEFIGIGR